MKWHTQQVIFDSNSIVVFGLRCSKVARCLLTMYLAVSVSLTLALTRNIHIKHIFITAIAIFSHDSIILHLKFQISFDSHKVLKMVQDTLRRTPFICGRQWSIKPNVINRCCRKIEARICKMIPIGTIRWRCTERISHRIWKLC